MGKRKRRITGNLSLAAEIREVAEKMAHLPVAEIVQALRERNIAADPDFVAAIAKMEGGAA